MAVHSFRPRPPCSTGLVGTWPNLLVDAQDRDVLRAVSRAKVTRSVPMSCDTFTGGAHRIYWKMTVATSSRENLLRSSGEQLWSCANLHRNAWLTPRPRCAVCPFAYLRRKQLPYLAKFTTDTTPASGAPPAARSFETCRFSPSRCLRGGSASDRLMTKRRVRRGARHCGRNERTLIGSGSCLSRSAVSIAASGTCDRRSQPPFRRPVAGSAVDD